MSKSRADQAKDWLASKGSQALRLGRRSGKRRRQGPCTTWPTAMATARSVSVTLSPVQPKPKSLPKKNWPNRSGTLAMPRTGRSTKQKQAGTWLKKKADLDGDGKVGIGDVFTGIGEVKTSRVKRSQIGGAIGCRQRLGRGQGGRRQRLVARWWPMRAARSKNAADRRWRWQSRVQRPCHWTWPSQRVLGRKSRRGRQSHWQMRSARQKDWAGDKLHSAKDAIHNAADRDGDGKVDWHDAVAGAGQLKNWAGDKLSSAARPLAATPVGAAKDWASDKLHAWPKTPFTTPLIAMAMARSIGTMRWLVPVSSERAGDKVSAASKTIGNAVGAAKRLGG